MNTFAFIIALGVLLVLAVVVIGYLAWRLHKAESAKPAGSSRQSRSAPRTGRAAPSGSRNTGASRGPDERTKFNWLLGRSGSVKGTNFPIGEQTVSAGRDVRNFIQISSDAVSNRHAVLVGDAEGLTLIDVDSSNGTFLNGKQIDSKAKHRLNDGDEIKIADAIFLYRRQGRYDDHSQSQSKEISLQAKTAALTAVGPDGTANAPEDDADLNQQVLMALSQYNGDYQAVADALDLDVSIVQQIIQNATRGR